jgi:hypothetical protein
LFRLELKHALHPMGTSVYATYKCNMCNTSWTHVEQPSETCVACTLKQTHETIETELETSIAIIVISMFQCMRGYTFVQPMHGGYVWPLQHLNYT